MNLWPFLPWAQSKRPPTHHDGHLPSHTAMWIAGVPSLAEILGFNLLIKLVSELSLKASGGLHQLGSGDPSL